MPKKKIETTTAPVRAGDSANVPPEFGRISDLTRLFGIRRGTAYNLLRDGKIRGCLLRVRGKKIWRSPFRYGQRSPVYPLANLIAKKVELRQQDNRIH